MRAIAEMGRYHQLPPATDTHTGNPLVPSSDDCTGAEFKLDWLLPIVRRIEDSPVIETTGVVHPDNLPTAGCRSGRWRLVDISVAQTRARLDERYA